MVAFEGYLLRRYLLQRKRGYRALFVLDSLDMPLLLSDGRC
jgi:hypothetical protein